MELAGRDLFLGDLEGDCVCIFLDLDGALNGLLDGIDGNGRDICTFGIQIE